MDACLFYLCTVYVVIVHPLSDIIMFFIICIHNAVYCVYILGVLLLLIYTIYNSG